MMAFLKTRPVHSVVMSSFIQDNGVESELNRGRFFGCFDEAGNLEGVALIGHSTLVEAKTERALFAFAIEARNSKAKIHLIMSKDEEAQRFFEMFSQGESNPRLTCTELMFQTGFPFPVQKCEFKLRHATEQDLMQVAEAQAEVAFAECGVDPLVRDRKGFLERCSRRIEQKRVFVAFEGEKLVFKADIIAEASDIIYLEGVYVSEEYRGKGIGSRCLSDLCRHLLGRASQICLLSNEEFEKAHKSFRSAGLNDTGKCTTIFV